MTMSNIIWPSRREYLAIAVACAAVALLVAAIFWPSSAPSRKFASGAELAKILIQRAAENNGVAELSGFGGKVCIGPGGASSDFYVKRLFPGYRLAYQETDESSGVWFVFIGFEITRTVEIYGVPTPVLLWEHSRDVALSSLVTCPSELVIANEGGTVVLAQGPKRVPTITSIR